MGYLNTPKFEKMGEENILNLDSLLEYKNIITFYLSTKEQTDLSAKMAGMVDFKDPPSKKSFLPAHLRMVGQGMCWYPKGTKGCLVEAPTFLPEKSIFSSILTDILAFILLNHAGR